jgi:hypothetical protein
MEQDKGNKPSSEVGKNVWAEGREGKRTMEQKMRKPSFGQWWEEARPTKTIVFWSWIASIILTMIIGFAWGGWVTGGTAQKMAETMAGKVVSQRLVPICVFQFNQDPLKDQKLKELEETSGWKRGDYVETQGWATMPGEEEPDDQVATECAKLLMLINK